MKIVTYKQGVIRQAPADTATKVADIYAGVTVAAISVHTISGKQWAHLVAEPAAWLKLSDGGGAVEDAGAVAPACSCPLCRIAAALEHGV